MADKDLYALLGVPKGASQADIKKAYRKLARELHPDRNPGNVKAEERFKEVSYAHGVLSDEKKKALYDEFGEMGLKEGFNAEAFRSMGGFAGGGRGGGVPFEEIFGRAPSGGMPGNFNEFFVGGNGGGVGGMGDLFEALRGGGRGGRGGRARKRQGEDVEAGVTISFAEALKGAERELELSSPELGRRTIKVRIPKGIKDGAKVRLRGQGAPGSGGGEAGDLLLRVHVEAHPHFRREGDDLHLDLPIGVHEAWRGASVKVPTPDGDVSLKIPARTQGGATLRLRGKGVEKRDGSRGDLFVVVQLRLPLEGASPESTEAIDTALKSLESDQAERARAAIHL